MDPLEEEKLIRISTLILRQLQGRLSVEDRAVLDCWLDESAENRAIYVRCLEGQVQRDAYIRLEHFENLRDFESVKHKFRFRRVSPKTPVLKKLWPYVAAACVLVAMVGVWYQQRARYSVGDVQHTAINDRLPASNRAVITLSDGRQYTLNQQENQVVIDGNGIHYDDGRQVASIDAAVSAKIETPRGGTYDVTLPDGTLVKLNAGTLLTYPTVFAKDRREVNLTGEAYFEVAKRQGQPFVVTTKNQQVAVLGTHFNVRAYPDATVTKTTLLEGKVRVKEMLKGRELLLSPGDQAVRKGTELSRRAVDVQQELAWVYGRFNFDGKSLREVMDELSRWYAVDVVYKGEIPDVSFFGGTFRTSRLSSILKILKDQDLSYQLTDDGKLIIEKSDPKGQKGGL